MMQIQGVDIQPLDGLKVIDVSSFLAGPFCSTQLAEFGADVVKLEMPKVGDAVVADKVCGEVESTKSVSEIFSPVTGTVVAINDALSSAPELVNSDPYGAGWLAEISVSGEPAGLLTAAQYGEITG